jgi:hypothetical protein
MKYLIPVSWEVFANVLVEADSLDEAIDNADDIQLPKEASYIQGSFKVDREGAHNINMNV